MLSSCPICGSGKLKPVFVGKTTYLFEGDEPRALGNSKVYSCGSNGHLVIIPAEKKPTLQISEMDASAAPGSTRVLNSWKEIANHMGRGVRTVQRWEKELGFPVRRPRRKSRSAVIALVGDLDEWLRHAPVGSGSNSEGQRLDLESDESNYGLTEADFPPPPR
jgi:hypothetical protein